MKLSPLHCELLLTWFRENATPEQRAQLQIEMPLAYAALVEDLVPVAGGVSANLNAVPIKRPSARRQPSVGRLLAAGFTPSPKDKK